MSKFFREHVESSDIQTLARLVTQDMYNALLGLEAEETPVPELGETLDQLMHDGESLLIYLFTNYTELISDISNLTDSDLELIEIANKQLSQDTSAARTNAADFIRGLNSFQRKTMGARSLLSGDPTSKSYRPAIRNLTEMMAKGHKMKEEGRKPQDGDPESDSLIWGHTQLTSINMLIHFGIAHYLERYMSNEFKDQFEFAKHKDWFLNVITDLMALRIAKGQNVPGEIDYAWSAPRDQGGLGWLSEERIAAYIRLVMKQEA